MPAGIVWTDERVALLKKLWGEGFSCSQIAKRIGSTTRNGVIGKIHRMGLPGRPTTHRARNRPKPKTRPLGWFKPVSRIPIPTDPLPPRHETDIARVSFIDLIDGKHCKFIPGNPTGPYEPQFCGLDALPNSPYCHAHTIRCGPDMRTTRPYERPRIGRVMLNTNGAVHTLEDA